MFGKDNEQKVRYTIVKEDGDEKTLCAYRIRAFDDETGAELGAGTDKDISNAPRIVFYYNRANQAKKRVLMSQEAGHPVLFWHNGIKWVRLAGNVSSDDESITIRSLNLGLYAVKLAPLLSSFELTGIEPKIFSPDETSSTIARARVYVNNPDARSGTS